MQGHASLATIKKQLGASPPSANPTWLALSRHKLRLATGTLGDDYVLSPKPSNDSPNIVHELSRALCNLWPETKQVESTDIHKRVEALERSTADAFHLTLNRLDEVVGKSNSLEQSSAGALHKVLDRIDDHVKRVDGLEQLSAGALHKALDRIDDHVKRVDGLEQSSAGALHKALDRIDSHSRQAKKLEDSTADAFHQTLDKIDEVVHQSSQRPNRSASNVVLREIEAAEMGTVSCVPSQADTVTAASSEQMELTKETIQKTDAVLAVFDRLPKSLKRESLDMKRRTQNLRRSLAKWEQTGKCAHFEGLDTLRQEVSRLLNQAEASIDASQAQAPHNAIYDSDATDHGSY